MKASSVEIPLALVLALLSTFAPRLAGAEPHEDYQTVCTYSANTKIDSPIDGAISSPLWFDPRGKLHINKDRAAAIESNITSQDKRTQTIVYKDAYNPKLKFSVVIQRDEQGRLLSVESSMDRRVLKDDYEKQGRPEMADYTVAEKASYTYRTGTGTGECELDQDSTKLTHNETNESTTNVNFDRELCDQVEQFGESDTAKVCGNYYSRVLFAYEKRALALKKEGKTLAPPYMPKSDGERPIHKASGSFPAILHMCGFPKVLAQLAGPFGVEPGAQPGQKPGVEKASGKKNGTSQ